MTKCLLSVKHLKTFSVLKHSTNALVAIENDEIKPCVYNRNPRNLERMRIAYKPTGFHLEAPGREFWHKIDVKQNNRYVTASVIHWTGPKVIEASTKEWAIKKYLYRCTDAAAYRNLAKVFAQRCLESGISNLYCNIDAPPEGKVAVFLSEVEKAGLSLTEPTRFLPWRPWDRHRPEKPWEVLE
ncbi:hypothetical protein R5R35_012161 [Gryllus longicercus]|uniref:Large ribosomal subunit protein uL18m n=1 Tax=Gryllus longicercus TaxID=2509291 RepID=A0AAN9VY90_9ORTH